MATGEAASEGSRGAEDPLDAFAVADLPDVAVPGWFMGARRRAGEASMWWIVLVAGLLAIGAAVVQVGRYFREVPEREGAFAGSGPAHRLVAAAMLAAAGLFLIFFGLANLMAEHLATA